ncbi:hypothetical protein Q8A67_008873 [Cirrhinus molitorella]|uniref:G protein gamma domain-containing protein n=1 Tax=Cirrhinus molitorella TaxID=172907 RepID=A0AA88PTN8_9TELE|nr:hypothetical protein Q8A67_008873 [Cirrhinus molitorella]
MPEQSNDYRVVVFGAGGVGKSSLVLRFVKGTFRDTYIPTVEDTYRQVISCDKSVCTLQITDTTGSHQFPAMQRLSISKGHAFILVYSITSKQSLEELKPIYQQILAIKGNIENIPIMLVGNKSDETQREVKTEDGEAQSKIWKCAFMETSAKTNHNVTELFQELLNLEKKRNMSLNIDGKRSGKQSRADKLKGKCSIIHCAPAPSWVSRRYCTLRCKTGSGSVRPNVLAYEDWVDKPLRKVCFLDRSTAQKPKNPTEQRNSSPTDATKPNRLSFFPGEKSKFVCENAVTSGGGTDWVDTGARRGWCLFGRGGNNLREPGPLNYLHNHCRRDKQSCLQVPEPALVSSLSIIQNFLHLFGTITDGRECIERIKVSKAAADLMSYCEQHARSDPLLVGVPTSENPFKDKKPCIIL